MKIYDKASWHIDGGEPVADVVARFREVFEFLHEKEMLTEEGLETLEYAMDCSVSLNSTMLSAEGNTFIDYYYDSVIAVEPQTIRTKLIEAHKKFDIKD